MRARLLLGLVLTAACGGSAVVGAHSSTTGAGGSTSSTSTTGASGSTSSTSTTGAGGGCITPTVGEACSSGEVACQPTDPCCAGYEWACQSGSWQKLGLGCSCMTMPPFACGATTCSAGFFCELHPPGVLPPPDAGIPTGSYTCSPLPPSCASSPSCACIESALPPEDPCSTSGGAMCTEDASGNVTVVCLDV